MQSEQACGLAASHLFSSACPVPLASQPEPGWWAFHAAHPLYLKALPAAIHNSHTSVTALQEKYIKK